MQALGVLTATGAAGNGRVLPHAWTAVTFAGLSGRTFPRRQRRLDDWQQLHFIFVELHMLLHIELDPLVVGCEGARAFLGLQLAALIVPTSLESV